jgi:dTDP-6-deoxy-L-talose 4-dehydrogenase (NAD+)
VTDTSFVWCRLFWPYGPSEHLNRLIPSLINSLKVGNIYICKSSNLFRYYIHITNILEEIITILFFNFEDVINIGSCSTISLHDLSSIIALKLDKLELFNFNKGLINIHH